MYWKYSNLIVKRYLFYYEIYSVYSFISKYTNIDINNGRNALSQTKEYPRVELVVMTTGYSQRNLLRVWWTTETTLPAFESVIRLRLRLILELCVWGDEASVNITYQCNPHFG